MTSYGPNVAEVVYAYKPHGKTESVFVHRRASLTETVRAAVLLSPPELREARLDRGFGKIGSALVDPYTAVLILQGATAHMGEGIDRFTGSYHSRFQHYARVLRCRPAATGDDLRIPLTMISHANRTVARVLGLSWTQAEEFAELQVRKAIRGESAHNHRMELHPPGLRAFSDTRRSGNPWDWREFPDGVCRYAWETRHFDNVGFFR